MNMIEHRFIYIFPCSVLYIYYIIATAQTDISLRYRTLPLKINKLKTFSEILKCGNIKKIFKDLYCQMSSYMEFQLAIAF